MLDDRGKYKLLRAETVSSGTLVCVSLAACGAPESRRPFSQGGHV